MGWRRGEVWLDAELWIPEVAAVPAAAGVSMPSLPTEPPGLAASRRRRETWTRQRHARRARATAIALSPAVTLMLAGLRADGGRTTAFAAEDPPSLTFHFEDGILALAERAPTAPVHVAPKTVVRVHTYAKVDWHHARSLGLPYDGSLSHGTQLPIVGKDWITWNPITDSHPNLPERLYGNERTIRAIVDVTRDYRAAHPHAARVVIGDISRTYGGRMDDHISHQNGLDVDVYFPRRDRKLRAPTTTSQIDHRLAQDLLDRFVAAGAQKIFVDDSSGFRGPADVVMPWPGHEYHMHVRFRPPPG